MMRFSLLVFSALLITVAYSAPGFDTNGNDINECEYDPNCCPPCMLCINTYGSYYCAPTDPECDLDDHNKSLVNPNSKDCFLDIQRFDFKPGGFEIGIGHAPWSASFKLSKGTKIMGAVIYYCDWGGEVACTRGVRGVFATTSGSITDFVKI